MSEIIFSDRIYCATRMDQYGVAGSTREVVIEELQLKGKVLLARSGTGSGSPEQGQGLRTRVRVFGTGSGSSEQGQVGKGLNSLSSDGAGDAGGSK